MEKLSTFKGVKGTRLKMSYEAFLEWVDEGIHAEWVNGEVIVHMPPKRVHQNMVKFLYELLSLFVKLFDLGEVGLAPFEMKLNPDGPAREPDIFFVRKRNLARLTEDRLAGPADLIIEVISKSTSNNDRIDKFKEYEGAGVGEYWLVDPRPDHQRADFYYLAEDGIYQRFATEADERVQSQVLTGFWLQPDWLWQIPDRDPFPDIL